MSGPVEQTLEKTTANILYDPVERKHMGNLRIFLLRKSFSCIAKKVDNYLLSGQPFMFFTNKSMNIRLIFAKKIFGAKFWWFCII